MPQALAALFEYRSAVEKDGVGTEVAGEALEFLERVNGVLGVLDLEESSLDGAVEALIEARTAARGAKDWAEADRIRDGLAAAGIRVKDRKDGSDWELE